jgi:hypothetical protein
MNAQNTKEKLTVDGSLQRLFVTELHVNHGEGDEEHNEP